MFRTPITKDAIVQSEQHWHAAQKSRTRSSYATQQLKHIAPALITIRAVPVWSFAIGLVTGSRKKVTTVVEHPTKTVKTGTGTMTLINSALSVAALWYKSKSNQPVAGMNSASAASRSSAGHAKSV